MKQHTRYIPQCVDSYSRKASVYASDGSGYGTGGDRFAVEYSDFDVYASALVPYRGSLIAWINSYILRRVFLVFEKNDNGTDDNSTGEEG